MYVVKQFSITVIFKGKFFFVNKKLCGSAIYAIVLFNDS